MKYLKTYEGLFDFFKKKKETSSKVDTNRVDTDKECSICDGDHDESKCFFNKEFIESNIQKLKNCLVDLSDNDIQIDVEVSHHRDQTFDECFIDIYPDDRKNIDFDLLVENFRILESYLDELDLKVFRYELDINGVYKNDEGLETEWRPPHYFDSIDDIISEMRREIEARENIERVVIWITKI